MDKEEIEKIVRNDLPVGEPVTEGKIENVVQDLVEKSVDWGDGEDAAPSVDWGDAKD